MEPALAQRFDSLRTEFLAELTAHPDLLSPEAVDPCLTEFRDFLAEADLPPSDLCTEVVEFHLWACARSGANTAALERRLLALKAFFAWAATRGVPDLGADLEPLTREGRALSMLIYHRWPPPASPGVLVQLETDLPEAGG